MASRKLVRDFLISNRFFYRQLLTFQQVSGSSTRLRLLLANGYFGSHRQFSVFNDFSKQVKGEATRNQEFLQSVKELKEKAEELKGVTEDLKVRTKQTTEQLYKQVDGVWTEADATAKKVSANLKEKISATTEEVKETLGVGKQEYSEFSAKDGTDVKNGSKTTFGEENQQKPGSSDTANTLFGKFKSSVSSVSPKVSVAFQNLKEAKPVDLAKKGYDIVMDELSSNPNKRKRIEYGAASSTSSSTVERSTSTDVAVVPLKQSKWSKKWEAFNEKMQGHPIFKHMSGLSEPVVVKSQEFAEDIRDRWDTTDNPGVHKIQESFSLPEFVAEVEEVIKPVLNAYFKGDAEVLKKYCSNKVIEWCKAEHKAFESQGIFFDNRFQTQQVYCVRDRNGSVTEGGKDTIHTVYYAWALQQVDVEKLGEGALFPIWRLRELQQLGIKALI